MSDYVFYHGSDNRRAARPPRQRTPRVRLPAAKAPIAADCMAFFDLLFALNGQSWEAYRPEFLQRRLPACLRVLRVPTVEKGVARLRVQPGLAGNVLGAVLLGVTEFYRDETVFQQVRDALIPAWTLRPQLRRVWSAGCSDGHELYSIAILLAEAGMLEMTELLGSDCRESALTRAAGGAFRTEAAAGMPESWKARWFSGEGGKMLINQGLRSHLRWKQADLLRGAEPGPWHLVLFRNVAIYLDAAAAGRTWRALAVEMASGGCLITGKADYPPRGIGLVRIAPCIYQKVSHVPNA